jgi:hypothetical protein
MTLRYMQTKLGVLVTGKCVIQILQQIEHKLFIHSKKNKI